MTLHNAYLLTSEFKPIHMLCTHKAYNVGNCRTREHGRIPKSVKIRTSFDCKTQFRRLIRKGEKNTSKNRPQKTRNKELENKEHRLKFYSAQKQQSNTTLVLASIIIISLTKRKYLIKHKRFWSLPSNILYYNRLLTIKSFLVPTSHKRPVHKQETYAVSRLLFIQHLPSYCSFIRHWSPHA